VAELVDAVALGAVHYGFKSRRPLVAIRLAIVSMFFFKFLLVRSVLTLLFYNFFFSDQFRPQRPLPARRSPAPGVAPALRAPGVRRNTDILRVTLVLLRSSLVLIVFIFYT
jgi:hypothetical protein